MMIEDLLEEKKSDIVERWFDAVIESYPDGTAHFLKNQKDLFANPVGSNIYSGLNALMDCLIKKHDETVIKDFLDPIIRIRAVQTMFSPSQATAFIFDLKKIIRDILKKELKNSETGDKLSSFERKIDDLGLIAFDLFMECREKIFELKANQEKTKVYRAFERAGLIVEIQED